MCVAVLDDFDHDRVPSVNLGARRWMLPSDIEETWPSECADRRTVGIRIGEGDTCFGGHVPADMERHSNHVGNNGSFWRPLVHDLKVRVRFFSDHDSMLYWAPAIRCPRVP